MTGNRNGKEIAMAHIRMLANRRRVLAGAAATAATFAAPGILRADASSLKVAILLPHSGLQAGLGQDCQRGVDIAPAILKAMGLPDLGIMNGDTEFKRRYRALPRRAADQRGCAASGRRLQFPATQPRSLRSPNRRVFRSSSISPGRPPSLSKDISSFSAISRLRR